MFDQNANTMALKTILFSMSAPFLTLNHFSFFYRWDAKLGYHRYPSLPTTMKKLVSSGGYASELTLFLARKYPIVYQLDSKKYISQRNYDSLKIDQDLEQIYQEVQQEFEQREHQAQKARYISLKDSLG